MDRQHRNWRGSASGHGSPDPPVRIASWAPVPFEVEGINCDRLEAGTKARVAGMLAGKDLDFDVQVHEAECRQPAT